MRQIAVYYLKPYYLRMAWGFLIKFTGTVMDLLLPWALAYMIDTVIPENRTDEIVFWGLFMAGCSVLAAVFNILANRMASRVASDCVYTIREELFSKVAYLSSRRVDEFTRPSLISRLTADTYNVHQMLARIQRLGVRAPILLLGGIGMTMLLDPALAAILLAVLPLLAAVVAAVSKKSIPMFAGLQESVDRFVRLVREDIAGIRVIKALSKGGYERQRFDAVNREVVEREKKATMVTAVTNPAMNILLNLGLVAVILAGAWRVDRGISEVGKILAFMTYFTIILNALLSISRMFVVISKAAASAKRIVQVLEAEDERELDRLEGEEEAAPAGETPHIEFDRVTFSYNKKEPSLKDVSFRLKRGETLGIIGATGSGKSTVVSLLMRFYDVDSGSIRVDGQDIRGLTRESLRKAYAMVLQDTWLFCGTVHENLAYGREGVSREQVVEAAKAARIHSFITRLPEGYDTVLREDGANISKGQKQLLTIARAMLQDCRMLILDEATSNVDTRTEIRIQEAMRRLMEGKTCFVIAHRLSTIRGADRILVVDRGRIVEQGTHRELMERQGYYCRMYQAQFQ